MRYRTKLYLLFIALVFSTTFVGLSFLYWQARYLLLDELSSKVLTVAATTAELIDGELLKGINKPEDSTTEAFRKVSSQMKQIRDANRRDDVFVMYIYTMKPTPEEVTIYELGIDSSDESDDLFLYTGKRYPEAGMLHLHEHINEPWATADLYEDQFGIFLSGYAPIVDKSGNYVATLGVDLSAGYVRHELNQMKGVALLILLLTLIGGFLIATFIARFATRSLDAISACVAKIGKGDLKAKVYLDTKDEFGELAQAINQMGKGLEENQRLKLNFVRYVSRHVMEKIIESDVTFALKGERKKITVLFSDIRQFTHLAEKMSPEAVVSLLNEYLDRMLNVIFEHNGTLDKFIGDGLMVEFGAPLDDPQQEKNAVETAIAMHKALQELNRKWKSEGRPQLDMGVGIHTGQAVVGNIGSEKRMEYTAIGDTVNVASRLEHATREFKVPILISETTKEHIDGEYIAKNLGPLTLPGRDTPIVVYSVAVEK
jgi:adenylate cyclase